MRAIFMPEAMSFAITAGLFDDGPMVQIILVRFIGGYFTMRSFKNKNRPVDGFCPIKLLLLLGRFGQGDSYSFGIALVINL
jgi:hypothetical protein